MSNDNSEFVASMLKKLAKIDYVRPGEIPNIDLYMDQVTTFMEEHLSAMKRSDDDKILTKTMINNYAKNNLLPPPVKKKYSKDHLLTMIYIYYFKNLMSISDIQTILNPLTDGFFNGKGSVSMEHIYKEVYRQEKARLPEITSSIASMLELSKESFQEVNDKDDKEYLQMFTFISLLCFDMYMKKEMVESIIDDMATDMKNKAADDTQAKDKNTKKK